MLVSSLHVPLTSETTRRVAGVFAGYGWREAHERNPELAAVRHALIVDENPSR